MMAVSQPSGSKLRTSFMLIWSGSRSMQLVLPPQEGAVECSSRSMLVPPSDDCDMTALFGKTIAVGVALGLPTRG